MDSKYENKIMFDDDSDSENDPGKLLNAWLGELDKMKQDLTSSNSEQNTILRRRKKNLENSENHQIRCSLINLDNNSQVQDEEWDAILGELSVLESQFDNEMEETSVKGEGRGRSSVRCDSKFSDRRESEEGEKGSKEGSESPTNDSAFCDNYSVLSSSSSYETTEASKNSSTSSTFPSLSSFSESEAKIKADKIKLAIEKIKEASIKKLFIKVFTADASAKSLLVDEKMTVGVVTRILAEKNHVKLHSKWAIVELIPDLYMERVYEDHENLVENCLMWKMNSKNTLWFIERPEKFDCFLRPEKYLLGSSSSQRGDALEDHARTELLEEYFNSTGVGAPDVEGFVYLKAEGKKSWKKFFMILRTSGLYYGPKGKKTSKDLICLSTFDVNQIYYGTGWKKKYKAPTNYGFAIKNPTIQVKTPKYIRYLCVETETELHRWVTGIRIAKNSLQLYRNYRAIEEDINHDDIDILASKRFSGVLLNSSTGCSTGTGLLQKDTSSSSGVSDAITPSSENKSFDSTLSSGIISDILPSDDSLISKYMSSSTGSTTQCVNHPERSSSSIDSSGCVSSSSCSIPSAQGFESDFPIGGTIKKRLHTTPRLPLTTTTWAMIRDSDDDESEANVRVGSGGTLLRSTKVLHSQLSVSSSSSSSGAGKLSFESDSPVLFEKEKKEKDPHSLIFESRLKEEEEEEEELPLPPPPDESESDGLDDLPPPPSQLFLKKPRRISFDDNVQLIEDTTESYSKTHEFSSHTPKSFLKDLQRVMTRKWQIAEKCKEDRDTTPHHVLGFRDEVPSLVGAPQIYNRADKVGQWVLESQYFNEQPIYASSSIIHHQSEEPVILRDPLHDYGTNRYPNTNNDDNECNLKTSSILRNSLRYKKPPAPPRRSENTQLTSQS